MALMDYKQINDLFQIILHPENNTNFFHLELTHIVSPAQEYYHQYQAHFHQYAFCQKHTGSLSQELKKSGA